MSKFEIVNLETVDMIYWHDLTPEEQTEFDYRDTEERQNEYTGFRYRGNVYDMSEFGDTPPSGWDAASADTYFSGILFRMVDDGEAVEVATWIC